jgi:hypothetical protein
MEYVHMITSSAIKVEDKKRRHFAGTSFGNVLGPVVLPSKAEAWCMDPTFKKTLYGIGNRVEVGGKVPGMEDVKLVDLPAIDQASQPMCFHAPSKMLLQELTHCYGIRGWINLTGCEGTLEEVCIENRIPCFTVCFSNLHVQGLRERLIKQTFANMQEESSPIFSAGLMSILGKKVTKKKAEKEETEPKKKAESKKGKKPTAKAKGKKTEPKKSAKGKPSAALAKLKQMQDHRR